MATFIGFTAALETSPRVVEGHATPVRHGELIARHFNGHGSSTTTEDATNVWQDESGNGVECYGKFFVVDCILQCTLVSQFLFISPFER